MEKFKRIFILLVAFSFYSQLVLAGKIVERRGEFIYRSGAHDIPIVTDGYRFDYQYANKLLNRKLKDFDLELIGSLHFQPVETLANQPLTSKILKYFINEESRTNLHAEVVALSKSCFLDWYGVKGRAWTKDIGAGMLVGIIAGGLVGGGTAWEYTREKRNLDPQRIMGQKWREQRKRRLDEKRRERAIKNGAVAFGVPFIIGVSAKIWDLVAEWFDYDCALEKAEEKQQLVALKQLRKFFKVFDLEKTYGVPEDLRFNNDEGQIVEIVTDLDVYRGDYDIDDEVLVYKAKTPFINWFTSEQKKNRQENGIFLDLSKLLEEEAMVAFKEKKEKNKDGQYGFFWVGFLPDIKENHGVELWTDD